MLIDFNDMGAAGFSLGIDPSGREYVIVVVKRALAFPAEQGAVCPWSEGKVEICVADQFTGEPGFSATVREADYALRKPACDLILNGFAHSPGARPVTRLRVGATFGRWAKSIDVVGNRTWESGLVGADFTDPAPFTSLPISYDYAFGGIDDVDPDEELPRAYEANPAGRGWHRWRNRGLIDGKPLPNCEQPGEPVESPWGDYLPAAFGPVGRGWPERAKFAGTYDEEWVGDTFPFLPDDFDDRYYQCAPPDQQVPHPRGGEEVKLQHLVEDAPPVVSMRLPDLRLPVVFRRSREGDIPVEAVVDTVEIEPEDRKITLTWRASLPLRRDLHEMREAIIGHRPRGFWRARRLGKRYSPLAGLGRPDAGEDEA